MCVHTQRSAANRRPGRSSCECALVFLSLRYCWSFVFRNSDLLRVLLLAMHCPASGLLLTWLAACPQAHRDLGARVLHRCLPRVYADPPLPCLGACVCARVQPRWRCLFRTAASLCLQKGDSLRTLEFRKYWGVAYEAHKLDNLSVFCQSAVPRELSWRVRVRVDLWLRACGDARAPVHSGRAVGLHCRPSNVRCRARSHPSLLACRHHLCCSPCSYSVGAAASPR